MGLLISVKEICLLITTKCRKLDLVLEYIVIIHNCITYFLAI